MSEDPNKAPLPEEVLRGWAKAYRDGPAEYRFPSDPNAEFFPQDLEWCASEIDRLRREREEFKNRFVETAHAALAYATQRAEYWAPVTDEQVKKIDETVAAEFAKGDWQVVEKER